MDMVDGLNSSVVLTTVVKNVHDVLIPCTKDIWNEKVAKGEKKFKNYAYESWSYNFVSPKCCLACAANKECPFPCFKAINSEKASPSH